MKMRILHVGCLALFMLPGLCMGAEALLLDDDALSKKIEQVQDYQLLDARTPETQRIAPLAFATRYWINARINKALVLVVADSDAEAVEIAQSIPAENGRAVFAVKGGDEAWRRVSARASTATSVSKTFVIPKNTCEQGKPIQELKRDRPLQQFQKK
jgi:hypothetical protein